MTVTAPATRARIDDGADPWWTATVESPIGPLVLEATAEALTEIRLPDGGRARLRAEGGASGREPAPMRDARRQLSEYFAGRRRAFDLPLELTGTAFQRDVWWALADIAYGETVSYAELAAMVGRPTAFRAVGQANGANPIPIVLPCHRVVASGGRIGGYGGGLPVKRRLLALEG
ncbi:MAG: methylated-DNA--[protein]-cysteine S-methyltransferase, partial [Acidobacteriota bacterium]|nr:methylated-DNA--[protein]-cysteine S-methyltransferase [Acidobacteriota bacterium]